MADNPNPNIPPPPSGSIVAVSGAIPPPPTGSIVAVNQTSGAIPAPPSGTAVPVSAVSSSSDPNYGTDQWYQEKIGSLVPQSVVPALAWLQQNINDPLNKMAAKGAEFGKELGSDVVSGVTMLAHPDYLGASLPSPYGPKPPVQTPESMAAEEHPVAKGVAEGVGSVAGGALADPRNWPFLASSAARPILQRVISGGFGTMMGKDAIATAQDLYDNWKTLTPEQRSEKITQGGLSALMSAGAITHAATGGDIAPETEPDTVEHAQSAKEEIPAPPTGFAVEAGEASPVPPRETEQPSVVNTAPVGSAAKPEGETVTPGPGAQNLGTGVNEGAVDISDITKGLRAQVEGAKSSAVDIARKVGGDIAEQVSDAAQWMGDAPAKALGALEKIKAVGQAIFEKYAAPPDTGDLMKSVADWQFAQQKSDLELSRFTDAVKKAFPDVETREAMAVYAESGGDLDKLKAWEAGSKPELAQKYKDAQSLDPAAARFAENARVYWNSKLDQAIDQGILSHGIEDYIMHLVKRENPITNQLRAEVDLGKLNTNPSFAKQRIHDTIYDLEQNGFLAENDLGHLMAAYDQSFNKALASRAYIKSLLEGKAKDGRPLAVVSKASAKELPGEVNDTYLIRTNAHPEDTGDYRSLDHPALRGWKWADKLWGDRGENDKNVVVQGDLLLHPDAFRQVKNNLSKSWFRNYSWDLGGVEVKPFAAAMKVGQLVKGTMLDLSGFHQTQLSIHGMEHVVNPFSLIKEIDLNDPVQEKLMRWGTQVADYRASEAFSEGSTSGSLIRKVPGLGQVAQTYNEYLFKDFIPRMKMTMATEALRRNMERYSGKLSEDQIYALTAKQANAAFGELNYKMLGRNATFQDLLRLTLLAPDFLEARGRFVAQGLKPFGREQSRALVAGAVAMYVGARIANQVIDNDPHWDKPFSVVYDGKEYRLRTVQGDLEHLVRDPQQFAWVRLNPVTAKPLIELLTKRDEFGRPITPGGVVSNTAKNAIPIAFQKWIKNPGDFTLLDSVLQSAGVSSTKHLSAGAKAARDYVYSSIPKDIDTADAQKKGMQTKQLQTDYAAGNLSSEKLQQMHSQDEITEKQARKIAGPVIDTVVSDFKRLPIEKGLDFWPDYTPAEQKKLSPILRQKAANIDRLDRTSLQKQELRTRAHQALTK